MPCGPCAQQRRALVVAARKFDLRGMAGAVTRGSAIAADKLRGVDVEAKYGTQPVVKASPYRRPPERT
jgi:hypothetical protein